MARHTRETATDFLYDGWVVCGLDGTMKLSRQQPYAGLGEIAVSVTIQVPRNLFKRPLLRASITLPETPPMQPDEAIKVVVDAIENGCDLSVAVSIEATPK